MTSVLGVIRLCMGKIDAII